MSFKKTIYLIIIVFLIGMIPRCTPTIKQVAQQDQDLYWKKSSPALEGMNALVIDSIHREIQEGKYGFIDYFLLIRNGKLIFDHKYRHDYGSVMAKYDTTNKQYNYDHTDWHPYYNHTDLHTLQSVTKSINSILLGIAMDQGLIKSVQEPILSYFNRYTMDQNDHRKKSVTIHDLLTMRSGFTWDESNYDEATNSCIIMEGSEDWIQYVLDQPMDTTSGKVFEYNSGASVLLGKIIRQATGKRVDRWAEEVLFRPLGIKNYYWKVTPMGEIDTEGGLYLSAHDLAKIGSLMLQGGEWEGRQIISKQWVAQSIRPFVKFNATSGYGLQWWVPKVNEDTAEIFAGNGYGGQFLMVVPKYQLVLVFNGWNIHDRPTKSTWRVLEERIIPGIIK